VHGCCVSGTRNRWSVADLSDYRFRLFPGLAAWFAPASAESGGWAALLLKSEVIIFTEII
jgi:hypothetical protein